MRLFKKKNKKIEKVMCPVCEGRGYIYVSHYMLCPRCDGIGKVELLDYEEKTCGCSGYRLED